jgi:hypothetical protein
MTTCELPRRQPVPLTTMTKLFVTAVAIGMVSMSRKTPGKAGPTRGALALGTSTASGARATDRAPPMGPSTYAPTPILATLSSLATFDI